MMLQLGICVIVAVLLMGSVSCALRGMDRRDEGGEGYAVWSVGMMLGVIVGILFLLFGPNGVIDVMKKMQLIQNSIIGISSKSVTSERLH